jgi:hypothetical protein
VQCITQFKFKNNEHDMNLELSFELHAGIQFKHGLSLLMYMEGIEQMENQKSLSNLKNDLIDHHWALKDNC